MPGLIVYLPSLLKAGTEIFITAHGGTELSPDSGDGCGSAPFKFPSFHIVAQIMPYQLHSRLNMHCLSVATISSHHRIVMKIKCQDDLKT